MKFVLSPIHLKTISSVLTNLAAGWIGSIVVLPGVVRFRTFLELAIALTYSLSFATLAIYFVIKIEESIYDK